MLLVTFSTLTEDSAREAKEALAMDMRLLGTKNGGAMPHTGTGSLATEAGTAVGGAASSPPPATAAPPPKAPPALAPIASTPASSTATIGAGTAGAGGGASAAAAGTPSQAAPSQAATYQAAASLPAFALPQQGPPASSGEWLQVGPRRNPRRGASAEVVKAARTGRDFDPAFLVGEEEFAMCGEE